MPRRRRLLCRWLPRLARQLEMHRCQTTYDETRFVFHIPLARRPVPVCRKIDMRGVFEEFFEQDAHFGTRQGSACAHMGTTAEGQMFP